MIRFIIGLLLGNFIGILLMCILQINREEKNIIYYWKHKGLENVIKKKEKQMCRKVGN